MQTAIVLVVNVGQRQGEIFEEVVPAARHGVVLCCASFSPSVLQVTTAGWESQEN